MDEISVELTSGQLSLHHTEGSFALSAQALRSACRCADCRAAGRAGVPIVPPRDVELVSANEVGSYALQLCFSDGHERGIYPWAYLAELAAASSET